jgi:hypothetical protein
MAVNVRKISETERVYVWTSVPDPSHDCDILSVAVFAESFQEARDIARGYGSRIPGRAPRSRSQGPLGPDEATAWPGSCFAQRSDPGAPWERLTAR